MKVLFLESHPVWIYGLPNGFRDLGHEVLISGPLTEENIPKMILDFKPNLIVTMAWTPENTDKKLKWIRKYVKPTKIPLIYWSTEDPSYTNLFSLPLMQKILPDFVFTICTEKVDFFKMLGFKAAHLSFGYHESVHHPSVSHEKYKTSIALVANAYTKYMEIHPECYRNNSLKILISPLLKNNYRIDFWGKDWDKMDSFVDFNIPRDWIHGYLPYTEANKVYSSADIVIGLQNSQLTQRTYEILGSEGFLLTNETSAVKKLFKNSEELVMSSSSEETLNLVNYYLSHSEEREKIRKSGSLAVKPHNYKYRAEYIIRVLKDHGIIPMNLN